MELLCRGSQQMVHQRLGRDPSGLSRLQTSYKPQCLIDLAHRTEASYDIPVDISTQDLSVVPPLLNDLHRHFQVSIEDIPRDDVLPTLVRQRIPALFHLIQDLQALQIIR